MEWEVDGQREKKGKRQDEKRKEDITLSETSVNKFPFGLESPEPMEIQVHVISVL